MIPMVAQPRLPAAFGRITDWQGRTGTRLAVHRRPIAPTSCAAATVGTARLPTLPLRSTGGYCACAFTLVHRHAHRAKRSLRLISVIYHSSAAVLAGRTIDILNRWNPRLVNQGNSVMRCLLIEDEAETGRYICTGLQECGYSATLCVNGVDGMHHAINETWDILIIDRLLPGGVDGLSIVRKLRDLGKKTPVLILSALSSTDERVHGLRSGGDDYISKPFAFSELLARVEALLRRAERTQDSPLLQVADLRLDTRTFRVTRGSIPITLQPRELRLLAHLMRHADQVVTRTMLLEAVWDCHFDPQTNVIDVQISRLRSKVDRGFTPQLIHTMRGVGYLLGRRG